MLKTILTVALALALAFGLGVGTLVLALDSFDGLSRLTVGPWSAQPWAGTPAADPYARARAAREASLPLGQAEGLAFTATRDSDGQPLDRACEYRLAGAVPAARFFTLYARGGDGAALASGSLKAPALHSWGMLRGADGTAEIAIGGSPAPGNWLQVEGGGPMALVLTLYDTPVAASAGGGGLALPTIARVRCHG